MQVVLIRKLAEQIDGVNLTEHQVGDVLDLAPLEAELLTLEGWAIRERRTSARPCATERRGASATPQRNQPAAGGHVG
jgi:hypothetical protein